jgi:hypothetical protein
MLAAFEINDYTLLDYAFGMSGVCILDRRRRQEDI